MTRGSGLSFCTWPKVGTRKALLQKTRGETSTGITAEQTVRRGTGVPFTRGFMAEGISRVIETQAGVPASSEPLHPGH